MNHLNSRRDVQRKSPHDLTKTSLMSRSLYDRKVFRVEYKVTNPKEEMIADILWMKKAAQMTKDSGFPQFKIKQRIVKKRFEKKFATSLSIIIGLIEVSKEEFSENFDADVIDSLPLEREILEMRNIRI